ncbi:pyridoxal phosphate-dependent aminotransferase [Alkalicoccus chagannorensis]|uniref:pyridoxal phosphate-dependent aminotransferase n=1 Tax=Alkalicoccus chagannorensis TaxID=427072 RepID=UPI0004258C3F|nr:pyridoxal phosphate-dependent aminotransferase [Alkalicoccus chagannorensis]
MTGYFPPSRQLERLPQQFFAKLVKQTQAKAATGADIINLGQGNPDLPTPPAVVERLQEAAEHPKFHKYSPFQGYPFLKQAAARFYEREYGVTLDPETEIAILPGAKTGLVELSQCLLNPGDTALLPDPGYPDYLSGTAIAGAEAVRMPLLRGNGFLPDLGMLGSDLLSRAKLMFLNYPNNPTGAGADEAFFQDTVRTAAANNICVCHDFAYGAIGFDEKKPPSFLQTPGAKDVGIEVYTLSKTFNMAGWRVAFAAGNASVISHLNLIQDHYFVSLFGAVQSAAATALDDGADDVEALRQTYQSRRKALMDALAGIGWEADAPDGSFFAWLPVPDGWSSEAFAEELLESAHVVTAPGAGFGEYGEGYVRAALLTSEDRLREAVERIGRLGLFKENE